MEKSLQVVEWEQRSICSQISRNHQRNKREGRITEKVLYTENNHLWTNQRKSAGLSSLRSPA